MRGSKIQMKRVWVDYDPASGAGERESCEKPDAQTVRGTQLALVEKSSATCGPEQPLVTKANSSSDFQ
jgi:hypothetical protein